MSIDEKQIEHIANLANLELSDEDKASITADFGKILAYVEKINSLDIADVPETSQVLEMDNVLREDEVKKSLDPDEVLKLAPDQMDNQIKVPKVL